MYENELCLIPLLKWSFSSRGSLASSHLSNFWAARGAGQGIWQDVHHPPYGLTCCIQGLGTCRRHPSSFPPHAPVGSFQDTPTGVSGPAAIITLQILPCFLLVLV